MKDRECETCIKRKTMFCPNSAECYDTENKPFYQNRIMLLEENFKLQARADKYKCRIDKAEECISNFLCTEEYINVDGKAIADNYEKILEILGGENNR